MQLTGLPVSSECNRVLERNKNERLRVVGAIKYNIVIAAQ